MRYHAIFHPVAEQEYTEALWWYEEQLKGLGDRFEQAVGSKINRILSNPPLYSKKNGVLSRG